MWRRGGDGCPHGSSPLVGGVLPTMVGLDPTGIHYVGAKDAWICRGWWMEACDCGLAGRGDHPPAAQLQGGGATPSMVPRLWALGSESEVIRCYGAACRRVSQRMRETAAARFGCRCSYLELDVHSCL